MNACSLDGTKADRVHASAHCWYWGFGASEKNRGWLSMGTAGQSNSSRLRRVLARLLGRVNPVRRARKWSNSELRKLAPLVEGTVINVSGWRDEDKEGSHYRTYFPRATKYQLSNYQGWRGLSGDAPGEVIELDLVKPLAPDLVQAYDVVFNHTTLEHIYDVQTAAANLCALSKDLLVLVVPFKQEMHGPFDGDFWRFTPYALRHMIAANGFEMIYESGGPDGAEVLYLFAVAARQAAPWKERFKSAGIAAPDFEPILRRKGS